MRRRKATVFAASVGLAGCFSTPLAPADGPANSWPLTTSEAPLTIETGDYRLTFRDDAWRMPESLVFLGRPQEERLSVNDAFGEDAIGLSLFDAYTVNAASPFLGDATRDLLVAGPARVATETTWTGPEQCTGAGPVANNRSKFSFYPDGRIVRHDEINTSGPCNKILGSVNSFVWRADTIGSYDLDGQTASMVGPPAVAPFPPWSSRPPRGHACLQDTLGTIAMTWMPSEVVADWQMIEVHLQPTTFGVGYYWTEDVAQQPMHTYVADTTLIVRAGVTCGDLLPQLEAAQAPATLSNAEYVRDSGTYRIQSGMSVASGELPPGFVLVYETSSPRVTITRTGVMSSRSKTLESGVDYIEQRDGQVFTLFMLDALHDGESLTVSM